MAYYSEFDDDAEDQGPWTPRNPAEMRQLGHVILQESTNQEKGRIIQAMLGAMADEWDNNTESSTIATTLFHIRDAAMNANMNQDHSSYLTAQTADAMKWDQENGIAPFEPIVVRASSRFYGIRPEATRNDYLMSVGEAEMGLYSRTLPDRMGNREIDRRRTGAARSASKSRIASQLPDADLWVGRTPLVGPTRSFGGREYMLQPNTHRTKADARREARRIRGNPRGRAGVRLYPGRTWNARVVQTAGGWRIYAAPGVRRPGGRRS